MAACFIFVSFGGGYVLLYFYDVNIYIFLNSWRIWRILFLQFSYTLPPSISLFGAIHYPAHYKQLFYHL